MPFPCTYSYARHLHILPIYFSPQHSRLVVLCVKMLKFEKIEYHAHIFTTNQGWNSEFKSSSSWYKRSLSPPEPSLQKVESALGSRLENPKTKQDSILTAKRQLYILNPPRSCFLFIHVSSDTTFLNTSLLLMWDNFFDSDLDSLLFEVSWVLKCRGVTS